jgi:uncharacterized tellurite resistance protein B-like protein
MRHYPRNSPQAAARLLALVMIADGNVCRSEVEAIRDRGGETSLGLPPGGFSQVLQSLCEDLLNGAQAGGSLSACLDDDLLDALMRDVDDPALQSLVIEAMAAAVAADGHLADGEQVVLQALHRNWRQPQTAALAGAAPA